MKNLTTNRETESLKVISRQVTKLENLKTIFKIEKSKNNL